MDILVGFPVLVLVLFRARVMARTRPVMGLKGLIVASRVLRKAATVY